MAYSYLRGFSATALLSFRIVDNANLLSSYLDCLLNRITKIVSAIIVQHTLSLFRLVIQFAHG
jgi:hypothetical protein